MAFVFSRIGLRIAAPAVLVACGLVGWLWVVQGRHTAKQSHDTLEVYADLVNRMVLSDLRDAMLAKDRPRIQRELTRFAAIQPIKSLRIVDNHGKVAFATDVTQLGVTMAKTDASCAICHSPGVTPDRRARTLRFETAAGQRVYRVAQPILLDDACLRCHDAVEGASVGVLLLDLDDDALTGAQRATSQRVLWTAAAATLLLFALLALLLGRNVVFRLRHLRHLLELLRTGARATVLSVGAADEIDDVTRAVQALTLDLDGRLGVERAHRRLGAALERQAGPVLLIDARGWIVAANRVAVTRFSEGGASLVGCWASHVPGVTAERLALVRAQGWWLPEGEDGPALMALHDPADGHAAFLALWMTVDDAPLPIETVATSPTAASVAWQLYAAVLADSCAPGQQGGATVLRFDARLGRVRRLGSDIAALGREARAEREDVDLKSLALIVLWDVKRDWPSTQWHTLQDTDAQVFGARYQLRELLVRLANAAAQQAGTEGHVVLIGHDTPDEVLLGAWASQPGGQVVLDPADAPALAHAVAAAHGGDVEVDPAFDLADTHGFSTLRLTCGSVGTLYVASLAKRPASRTWHEPAMRT
jgi:PAS domain-containing protein